MKLHDYSDDQLVKLLSELSAKATPGPWRSDPKRLFVNGQAGPVMSYLFGDYGAPEGMKVSKRLTRQAPDTPL